MYLLREKKVFIYGTGVAGRKVCELLEADGIAVTTFIDKRYQEIELYMDKPVLGMEGIAGISDKNNYVIIITIKNVYDHSEIANQLLKLGYHNIIYKPYEILQGKQKSKTKSIDMAYEALLTKYEVYSGHLETLKEDSDENIEDQGVILEAGDYVKTYIDATLLFTNQKEDTEWDTLNFVSAFPGIEMYYALNNQRVGRQEVIFKEFADYCAEGAIKGGIELSESWEKNIVENRSNIFGEMKRMYSLRKEFFVENCPTFEYLGKGKLRIVSSGKNRVAFLISQGDWYIPVLIRKEHYQEYINVNQVMTVHKLLGKDPLWCSIPHPMFYDRKVIAYNYLNTWVPIVGRYISDYIKQKNGTYDFSAISLADYSRDDGALSRHLRRMGCAVCRKMDETPLCRELDKLFGFDEGEFNAPKNQPADICINTYFNKENTSTGWKDLHIDKTMKVQFLLIGNGCREQLVLEDTHDCDIQLIFESVWAGERVEGYMVLNNEE